MLRLSRTSLALALLLPCLAAGPTVLAAAAEDPAWQRPARAQAARDAAFSIRYYLRRYGEAPVLAERLDRLEVPDPGGNPTLRSLVESALRLYRREASAAEQPALAEAARRTLLYFGAADTPLFAPAAPELLPMAPASAAPGWPPGTADTRDLPMDDPRGYALLRLGAFGELLTKLPTGLRLHTAAGTEGAWPEGCRPRRAWRLAFPGTVHGFQALAGECSDGGFALALWGFSSPSLFLHQAALQRAALAGAPEARVTHDPSARARTRDDLLLAPFGEGSPLPRRFDVLALGYFDELRDEFAGAALTESSGDGWRGFSARVGSASLVALEIDESWYGECLGASVARLLETGVAFSTLAFAGSAGALDYFPPYSLVFPTCFLSRTGERLDLPNAFAGDGTQDCHLAVESPLVETRDLLRAFAGRAATVDVESFALARAVRERRLALGAAYLVTDYPDARPPMKAYGLSQVRFTQRLEGPRAYARLLRSHLLSGARGFRHPLETALQRPIGPLSAAAARRAREALGPLSAAEQALAARIEAETPPVIWRTRSGRLDWLLRDRVALAPSQVDRLKGGDSQRRSLTPDSEDALYGARDYLFAGAGQNDDAALYGPVRVFLSSAAWSRSFATRSSGANFLARSRGSGSGVPPDAELVSARRGFLAEAVAPADYPSRLATLAVEGYRALARTRDSREVESLMTAAAAAPRAALWRAIDQDTDAYLEVKIPWAFPLEAVACIEEDPVGPRSAGAPPFRKDCLEP